MKLKLKVVGAILIALGIFLVFLSYSRLYTWDMEIVDSGIVPIAPNSSNELGFFTSFGSDLKKVEVTIDNGPWEYPSMWGDCGWIQSSY